VRWLCCLLLIGCSHPNTPDDYRTAQWTADRASHTKEIYEMSERIRSIETLLRSYIESLARTKAQMIAYHKCLDECDELNCFKLCDDIKPIDMRDCK